MVVVSGVGGVGDGDGGALGVGACGGAPMVRVPGTLGGSALWVFSSPFLAEGAAGVAGGEGGGCGGVAAAFCAAWVVGITGEPYALHNPAAVRQHLRGLGNQDVLCLCTSGTSTRIRAATLVQAATLGEGVRNFLFDAFLHVARHNRPPRATPDGESPPPTGSRIWVPPIDWGRHLVGHPVPERDSTPGRTRYREPNMARPPPPASPPTTPKSGSGKHG